ncbi:hypothetical protein Q8F55_006253 [Vanrija albida]|uniref:Uncharacterized protein n=1 Tax=Vanrija albida TaxID=181172 RepID=A0ABR3PWK0_9TREE
MLALAPLTLLLTSLPALALNWGDRCGFSQDGVCDSTARCDETGGYNYQGACPDLPDNVRCCVKSGCMHPGACPGTVQYGLCPGGGDTVYCEGWSAWCGAPSACKWTEASQARVLNGFCPGGEDNKLCVYKPN